MSGITLDRILQDRPRLHTGETETSYLRGQQGVEADASTAPASAIESTTCYGISPDVAWFIHDSVLPESVTLETGSGLSTLIFALRGSRHTTVTPNAAEFGRIKDCALDYGISMERVEFVPQPSDQYLPQWRAYDLDFVLIDGKHAFPWPILDWFYTADKLKVGGICLLDDLELASVAILRDFLSEDPHWKLRKSFRGHTLAFTKIAGPVHDVAWHMQPYLTARYPRESRAVKLAKRLAKKSGIPQALGIRR